ncbi:MAG: hypothetical protein QM775_06940 [Pirellulales bacterium]
MATVAAGTGLVSGLNYTQIVDSLIALDKAPVDLLTTDLNNRKGTSRLHRPVCDHAVVVALGLLDRAQQYARFARRHQCQ